jgi:TM2 domain-containing membrane protein YozV
MSRTRFFLICTFLCVIFSTNRICAGDYYSNALRIFNEKKFFAASIEFERAIFYETDINRIALFKYYKSLCYKELGDNTKTLEELGSINLFNISDSLYFLIRYQQALSNYLHNNPDQALWNIGELRFRIPDSSKIIEIIPINILCLNATNKWDEAHNLWNYFLENSGIGRDSKSSFKAEIDNLYKKRNLPRFHSPRKAENLSRFIPGVGQMYSGAVAEGSMNFLINASLLSFAAYEFYTQYYLTGYFVGLGLFNKTYHGGMHRANLLAEQKNREALNNFNLKNSSLMIRLIDSGNPLLKPIENLYILQKPDQ